MRFLEWLVDSFRFVVYFVNTFPTRLRMWSIATVVSTTSFIRSWRRLEPGRYRAVRERLIPISDIVLNPYLRDLFFVPISTGIPSSVDEIRARLLTAEILGFMGLEQGVAVRSMVLPNMLYLFSFAWSYCYVIRDITRPSIQLVTRCLDSDIPMPLPDMILSCVLRLVTDEISFFEDVGMQYLLNNSDDLSWLLEYNNRVRALQ